MAADGSIELAGRNLRCGAVNARLDKRLPNLGVAVTDARLMVFNPVLLRRYSETVQLFVFYHECGHHRAGGSELAADCWATAQGVRDGWLDKQGLADVCGSWGNEPETSTHPSAKRRCANLDRCFAQASSEMARDRQRGRDELTRLVSSITVAPKLVTGPRLVRDSVLR